MIARLLGVLLLLDPALVAQARLSSLARGGTTSAGALSLSAGKGCAPAWLPTFGGEDGLDGAVRCLAVHDDGSGAGPRLYAGGAFTRASNQPIDHVAVWHQGRWEPVGLGLDSEVYVLVSYGPALFAGGSFGQSGGLITQRVAAWDGTLWRPVSLDEGPNGTVRALAFFDDGNGLALYAGGTFTLAGGEPAARIARCDGLGWSALGAGMTGSFPSVVALAVHDDGSGPALYAGGQFTLAGGVPAPNVARWDGTSWSALAGGLNGSVSALAAYDTGSGPRLYAGGSFDGHLGRWNGTSWIGLAGIDGHVGTLTVVDSWQGGGPVLAAGGAFVSKVAVYNGVNWSNLGGALTHNVTGLAFVDLADGQGPTLLASNGYTNPLDTTFVARFDEDLGPGFGDWRSLGSGISGPVEALAVYEVDNDPRLFVAGDFAAFDGRTLLQWTGERWEGLPTPPWEINALAVHDDGSGAGPLLYVGHDSSPYVNRWDGSDWVAMPSPGGRVECFGVYDDGSGSGPALFAGGLVTGRIARWDGAAWSTLGADLGGSGIPYAFAVYDDGSGPQLYATGSFSINFGAASDAIMRWDGSSWSDVGGGLHGAGSSLAVHDDGSGPALFVGGSFDTAGGVPASGVARWNGSWSALGSGLAGLGPGGVDALAVYDDGNGAALFAAGAFTTAGGAAASGLARWDGALWSPLGAGVQGNANALAVFDLGDGPALLVAGTELVAPDSLDGPLAVWQGCPPTGQTWVDLGGGTQGLAGVPELDLGGTLEPGSLLELHLEQAPANRPAYLFIAFESAPLPFLGGTLHAFPFAELLVLVTDGAGEIHGSTIFPGAPPGTGLWFQVALPDFVPPYFACLSNGVRGEVP